MVKIIFSKPESVYRHTIIPSAKRIVRVQKTGYMDEVLLECSEGELVSYIYTLDPSVHAEYFLEFSEPQKRMRLDAWVNSQLAKLVNKENN